MLRGWLAVLAVLAGFGLSSGADSKTALLQDNGWAQARTHLAEGRPSEAKAVLEGLLRSYPKEPDLHFVLGLTSLRLRDPEAAEKALKQALAIEPNHVQARTLLGWMELEIRGDAAAAIRQYRKVIELRPDAPDAYINLGAAHKKNGDLEQALASYNEALRRHPAYAPALSNRGWVFIDRRQWDQARNDFNEALKINPRDHGALQGLAQVLEKTRDYAGAQAVLQNLMTQSPNFVFWLQWGRIGLIRFYWVILLIAIALYFTGRIRKARNGSHGG